MDKLYDLDFQLWIKKTIDSLENRDLASIDINHLIQELTELGKSEQKALAPLRNSKNSHELKFTAKSAGPVKTG